MKLQKFFLLSTIGLVSLAVLAVFALLSSIQLSKQASLQIADSVESVHALEELELSLLVFGREQSKSMALNLKSSSRLREVEADIAKWLKRVKGSSTEQARVRQIESQVAKYFASLQSKSGIHIETRERDSNPIEIIYTSIEDLVEISLKKTLEHQQQAANLAQFAFVFSLALLAAMAVGGGSLILAVRSRIYLPLLSLRKSMVSFKAGDPNSTLPESGLAELKEITSVFNEMSKSLSQQRETQLKFLAAVAHDLRNPLGAIKMSVELFLESGQSREDKEILNIIKRQATHLDRMVGDLLDTTRIEAGHLDLKFDNIDIRVCVREAALLFHNLSPLHIIKSDLPNEEVFCNGDPIRLGQVLNNLISNAIKYSPKGGEIMVTLKRNPNHAEVSVSDPGLGVSNEDLEHIFEPFRRSSTRDEVPGVGLGLSVVKRIIEAHQGTITVASQLNQGSVFKFQLPYSSECSIADKRTREVDVARNNVIGVEL